MSTLRTTFFRHVLDPAYIGFPKTWGLKHQLGAPLPRSDVDAFDVIAQHWLARTPSPGSMGLSLLLVHPRSSASFARAFRSQEHKIRCLHLAGGTRPRRPPVLMCGALAWMPGLSFTVTKRRPLPPPANVISLSPTSTSPVTLRDARACSSLRRTAGPQNRTHRCRANARCLGQHISATRVSLLGRRRHPSARPRTQTTPMVVRVRQ